MRGLVVALVLLGASPAHASEWLYSTGSPADRAMTRFRFAVRAGVWTGTFDRPERACDPSRLLPQGGLQPLRAQALRPAQEPPPPTDTPDTFCPHDNSDEIAATVGTEASFRVLGPFHLTVGLDLIYTSPDARILTNQLIVQLPFGVLFTWYEWIVRPIVYSTVTPVVFLTDGNRDFTVGAGGGAAVRFLDFGSISFTAGHNWSESVDHWSFQLGVHPLL